jgi:UPF0716 family protein affecting phage T7 exclusion
MIYFLLYLFLEVMVSVNIASAIGGLYTFFEILLSALVGLIILFNFRTTLSENMQAVSTQKIDLEEFQRLNIFTLLGAVLLILPGFLTDILGILLQFSVFTKMFVNRFSAQSKRKTHKPHTKENDVIDVEIIDNDSTER